MNENIFSTLEFDKIIHHLAQLPISPLGQKIISRITPLTDLSLIKQQLEEVSELKDILELDDPFPLSGLQDITAQLKKVQIKGSFLSTEELGAVVQTLEVARRIKSYFHDRAEKYPRLSKIVKNIFSFKDVEDEINRCVDRTNFELFDNASPELNRIRRSIKNYQDQIRKKLEGMVTNFSRKGYLQENLITVRNNRLVLMIKDEHRNKVKGLIHDQSATGATLFVEPMETLELNNKIHSLVIEEQKEVENILRRLTGLIYERYEQIERTVDALARLDFIFAKARFSAEIEGHQPAINRENRLEIIKGRHPLLVLLSTPERPVVPLDVTIGEDIKTLVISGPNAGGKTVTLKTIGLLCLMVACGMHIPADPNSDIPIFNNIFATIGDQQSIENDLSTFSSHVAKLQEIVNQAEKQDLILIDEVGSGTDPDEGAALAIAILEKLTAIGCLTVVSTHQGALKVFAHETAGVENGSMEFDRETLQPTYRFRLGIPGSSYAYEIANRLGLPEEITQRARELIGSKKSQVENLLIDLENRLQKYRSLTDELIVKKSNLDSLMKLYESRSQELKENEKKIKKEAIENAEQIIKDANITIERAIKQIKEKQADKESIKDAHQLIRQEKEKLQQERERLKKKAVEQPTEKTSLDKVTIGQEIFWQPYHSRGTVMSEPDASGRVLIQTGDVKVRVPKDELIAVAKEKQKEPRVSSVKLTKAKSLSTNEIDIRGYRVEEGIDLVDKFLDEAVLAGLDEIYIIHGKGTGKLREGIYKFLDKDPRVKSKGFPEWNLGDTGMTIVKLK